MPETNDLPNAIRSPAASERRFAARNLGELTASQRSQLLGLRASEPDRWVRQAMDRWLTDGSVPPDSQAAVDEGMLVDSETAHEIREQARAEIAELLVHELRHAALDIEITAEGEITDYMESETKRSLDSFRALIVSLSQIADASRGASLREVVLSDVVSEACQGLGQMLWPPNLIGPPGVTVRADPGLVRLAVSNCVRNALDSTLEAAHDADPVIITWGRTDRDAWVSILDDGVGITADIEAIFRPHQTTKGGSGHAGLGLTIARNALRAMNGEVLLGPRKPRGATCEIRWPQDGQK